MSPGKFRNSEIIYFRMGTRVGVTKNLPTQNICFITHWYISCFHIPVIFLPYEYKMEPPISHVHLISPETAHLRFAHARE